MQVNAAVGCLARIPLPDPFSPPVLGDDAASSPSGTPRSPWAAGFAPELWRPYVRDIALRVFASCALSGQVRLQGCCSTHYSVQRQRSFCLVAVSAGSRAASDSQVSLFRLS